MQGKGEVDRDRISRQRIVIAHGKGGCKSVKTRHIAFIGILGAAVFSGGWLFYAAGHMLPVPGGKFIAMTPYVGFAMAIAAVRVGSPWTMTLVALAMGAVAALFTPLMSLAIAAAGIAADLTGRLPRRSLSRRIANTVHAAAFPFWGFWSFTLVSAYLTRNPAYELVRPAHLAAAGAFVAIASVVGALLGVRFAERFHFLGGGET